MARRIWFSALALAMVLAARLLFFSPAFKAGSPERLGAAEQDCYLILFGLGDKSPTVWDGSIAVIGGRITRMEGWRFSGTDTCDHRGSWKASTRPASITGGQPQGSMLENGVLVTGKFGDADTVFSVGTARGSFSFAPHEISWGMRKSFLDNRVTVERVPSSTALTTSEEEQDFPAMAGSGDDVWISYVEFVHGDRSQAILGQLTQEPKSFDSLARPVGGDQVFLLHYSKSSRVWSSPIAVTKPGQDIMRAAVAVDGSGRVWVFWSANVDENFDLYARSFSQGQWSSPLRLTTDTGPDSNPVAVADSKGRVWVAWQGFRNDNLEILAVAQDGGSFSSEAVVSFSSASDWDPAMAASDQGEVAVAWDTYDKGDYDVYFRRLSFGSGIDMEAPVAVAASDKFEARASAAYDPEGRLWVAYEASTAKWGKDFGAYEQTGVNLYRGHTIRLKCFQGSDAFVTASSPALGQGQFWYPRIAVDPMGGLALAFRTSTLGRASVGSIWLEHFYYFDGATWTGPVTCPHTDGLLDGRPAMLALASGSFLMVGATDHRLSQVPGSNRAGDWINADICAAEVSLDSSPLSALLERVSPETAGPPTGEIQAEEEQVESMRDYRVTVEGKNLQLLRGEFHRHTEISGDGGGDGPLIDAYRYLIDAAYMDWGGCCDHDNGGGLEYNWWLEQKLTDAYKLGSRFIPMFSYERSVGYPEGHRNVVFERRGVRPLPRLPKTAANSPSSPAPDTQMLYRYLRSFSGVAASHTSATDMGTDWRDNDPLLEPVVEIYQGDRQNYEMPNAPRAINASNAIGGYRPLGFVSRALEKGYRLGFQASSDHVSTHMSYCNLWVEAPTREAIMEAFRLRRVYGATDNILADVRSGAHLMGEEFESDRPPAITVKLWGTAEFDAVHIIKDGLVVYTAEPGRKSVSFVWRDETAERGKASYYYVRGEQADGELVWVSPMWIRYR